VSVRAGGIKRQDINSTLSKNFLTKKLTLKIDLSDVYIMAYPTPIDHIRLGYEHALQEIERNKYDINNLMFHPIDIVSNNEAQYIKWYKDGAINNNRQQNSSAFDANIMANIAYTSSGYNPEYTYSWEDTIDASERKLPRRCYWYLVSHITIDGAPPEYILVNQVKLFIDTTKFALPMFALNYCEISFPLEYWKKPDGSQHNPIVRFILHENYNYIKKHRKYDDRINFLDEFGNIGCIVGGIMGYPHLIAFDVNRNVKYHSNG